MSAAPAPPSADHAAAFEKVAALLRMEEYLRALPAEALPFAVVNESTLLVQYRQAALWRNGLMAVSGVAVPENNSPYAQWLNRLFPELLALWLLEQAAPPQEAGAAQPELPQEIPLAKVAILPKHPVQPGQPEPAEPPVQQKQAEQTPVPPQERPYGLPFALADVSPGLQGGWEEWLPEYGFFAPLPLAKTVAETNRQASITREPHPPLFGGLLLFRQTPFTPADRRVLQHLSGAYGHSLSLAALPKRRGVASFSRHKKLLAGLFLAACLFPVRQSVLAPAEVVANDPWPVRAPIEGIVEEILIGPNAPVMAGQPIIRLDGAELSTRLAVAEKSLEVARTELEQTRRQAFAEREAKLRLAYLVGRVEQLELEREYVHGLLSRTIIKSPVDGVALLDAPEEWAGKPVTLGQRILTVADPHDLQLEVFLPIGDYLPQPAGAETVFYPNTGSPVTAHLYHTGYQAQETPHAGMSFRLRAHFDAPAAPAETTGPGPRHAAPASETTLRLGERGSAKLYGDRAPLVFVLLRKPFIAVRTWLGV